MNRKALYKSYIKLGYSASEDSKEFKDWCEEMESFPKVDSDTMFEVIAKGLKESSLWNQRDC